MNFQTHKINNEPNAQQKPKRNHKKIKISVGIFSSLLIILFLLIGIFKAIASLDFGVLLKVAGEELQQDSYGHTNFLLLGNGGAGHDGGDLTDSIIIASLDNNQKTVTLLSIPRDLYVKDAEVGNSKINEVYFNAERYFGSSTEGLEHLSKHIETIIGVPIHYWARIDFQGFRDIVDALGGLDVDIPEKVYDPYYPGANYGYETFYIDKGPQHIDGSTALKYVRSRKTTSDFDRANRQQLVINAIKEKALKTEVLFSATKISDILAAVQNNIETNITVKEILTLGSVAQDLNTEQITHRLIHDDPTTCGGFLYTPERQYYNNLFVLIPAGDQKFIHLYTDLNFNHPEIAYEGSKIHVLNGTSSAGIAGENKQILQRFCFDVTRYGNGNNIPIQETTYYYKGEQRPHALDFLQKIIPGQETTEIPAEYQEYMLDSDIILEIGSDYVNSDKYLEDPFYYLQTITPSSSTESDSSSDSE